MKLIYDDFYDEELFGELSERYRVPGFSYCLIKGGKAGEARGFGFADAERTVPVTGSTAFEAASLTKPLFALIVLRLIGRGLFGLDDRLSQLAPEIRVSDCPSIKTATVRHVLSHATGLVNWGLRPRVPLLFDPGSGFSYSGEGYFWLQRVVQRLTSKDFCALMLSELLSPLGMNASAPVFTEDILAIESRKFDESGFVLPMRTSPDTDSGVPEPNAAWSLYSGSADYSKFMLELLNNRGGLSDGLFCQMTSPQNTASDGVLWGLGWGIPAADRSVLWHWGDNGGYKSFAAMDTNTKDGICIFTNGFNGTQLCLELIKRLTDGGYWDAVSGFIKGID